MKITFDKRTYNIEDGSEQYEVIHIVKHPIEKYNNDSYFIYIYKEDEDPKLSGYCHFEPSDELVLRIKEIIKQYEQIR
jgi:hypothetical protein